VISASRFESSLAVSFALRTDLIATTESLRYKSDMRIECEYYMVSFRDDGEGSAADFLAHDVCSSLFIQHCASAVDGYGRREVIGVDGGTRPSRVAEKLLG
jgi:hypothetical protein